MIDMHGKELQIGDIIDMHQTIDGENIFIVESVDPLDVRFNYKPERKYQDAYDVVDLLSPCRYSGDIDWEIIGNKYLTGESHDTTISNMDNEKQT